MYQIEVAPSHPERMQNFPANIKVELNTRKFFTLKGAVKYAIKLGCIFYGGTVYTIYRKRLGQSSEVTKIYKDSALWESDQNNQVTDNRE